MLNLHNKEFVRSIGREVILPEGPVAGVDRYTETATNVQFVAYGIAATILNLPDNWHEINSTAKSLSDKA